jgi:hypothetical protein
MSLSIMGLEPISTRSHPGLYLPVLGRVGALD